MAYTSLYRRFRPSAFSALVGQEHISRTLIHAVSNQSFVHAYLFAGPRGTGKTSTAKILARAVNCLDLDQGEPCGKCPACLRSLSGESMDIIEIDAASNRGIDEIRDLRERVKFAPAQEKYKVYIIDEVHMLTGEAFNALLKTLEEPPQHVLFILATTEPHKIPLTVLSRCQRFDFRRISYEDIYHHLQWIAKSEKIDADEDAIKLIARKADGGLRDAVNLLDQCRGVAGETIKVETVNSILGLVDGAFIDALAYDLLTSNLEQVLQKTDQLIDSGLDLRQVIFDLLGHLRQALLTKVTAKDDSPVTDIPAGRILQVIQILGEAENRLRYSLQPRVTMELALMQACGLPEEIKAKEAADGKELAPRKEAKTVFQEQRKVKGPQAELPQTNPVQNDRKIETKAEIKEVKIAAKEEPSKTISAQEEGNAKIGNLDIEKIKGLWPKVLDSVTNNDENGTMAFLCWGKPVALKGNRVILEFQPDFELHMKALCNKLIHKNLVEEKLSELTGMKLIIGGQIGIEEAPKDDEGIQGQLNF